MCIQIIEKIKRKEKGILNHCLDFGVVLSVTRKGIYRERWVSVSGVAADPRSRLKKAFVDNISRTIARNGVNSLEYASS